MNAMDTLQHSRSNSQPTITLNAHQSNPTKIKTRLSTFSILTQYSTPSLGYSSRTDEGDHCQTYVLLSEMT